MKNLLCSVFYFIIIFYPLTSIMANTKAPSSRDASEADITIDKSLISNLINQGKYEEAKQNLLVIIKSFAFEALDKWCRESESNRHAITSAGF